MATLSPKFKKGQTVWGKGLGTGYIPDPYTITAVIAGEKPSYRVKGKRKPFSEDELFGSEEEAQVRLAAVFKDDTIAYLTDVIDSSRRIGCVDKVKDLLFQNGQLLIGEPERKTEYNTNKNKMPTPKFNIGQTVYGFVFHPDVFEKPKALVIKSVETRWFMGQGNEPAHWEIVYTMKRHGGVEVDESRLRATMDEALLMAVGGRFKEGFNNIVYSLEKRSTALGIEAEVKRVLLSQQEALRLEVLKD